MKISPSVTVGRLAQLKPGDLFLCPVGSGPFVGMVVHDPMLEGDRVIVSLGPNFPPGAKCPHLMPAPQATVISFGTEFQLRLPSQAGGWATEPPSNGRACIVVVDGVAYVRANFAPVSTPPKLCCVDLTTGAVLTRGSGYFKNM